MRPIASFYAYTIELSNKIVRCRLAVYSLSFADSGISFGASTNFQFTLIRIVEEAIRLRSVQSLNCIKSQTAHMYMVVKK